MKKCKNSSLPDEVDIGGFGERRGLFQVRWWALKLWPLTEEDTIKTEEKLRETQDKIRENVDNLVLLNIPEYKESPQDDDLDLDLLD